FSFNDVKFQWLTKTLTVVFRNREKIIDEFAKYKYGRDLHLFHLLLKEGKGYYFKEVFGIYNVHEGGVVSLKSTVNKSMDNYFIYKELYHSTKEDYYRHLFVKQCWKLLIYKLRFKINNNNLNT